VQQLLHFGLNATAAFLQEAQQQIDSGLTNLEMDGLEMTSDEKYSVVISDDGIVFASRSTSLARLTATTRRASRPLGERSPRFETPRRLGRSAFSPSVVIVHIQYRRASTRDRGLLQRLACAGRARMGSTTVRTPR
jgi:hypothetical protein